MSMMLLAAGWAAAADPEPVEAAATAPPSQTQPAATSDPPPVEECAESPPEPIVTRRVGPIYPRGLRKERTADTRCVMTVVTDPRGVPADVVPAACPHGFQASARDALLQWRWRPVTRCGEAVPIETSVAVVYRLE
jgi:periplasmic protein TonB